MKNVHLYIVTILFIGLIACEETDKIRISRLITTWSGKEILIPDCLVFTKYGKDTVEFMNGKSNYKIITYVDSIGCVRCKLKLSQWKMFMNITDSLAKSPFYYFYFHPKDSQELCNLLQMEDFSYPVCFDFADEFNRLNHLPADRMFQTFLLDAENKVLAIGNPILNPKVRAFYISVLEKPE